MMQPVAQSEDARGRNTLLVLALALAARALVIWYGLVQMPAGWLYTHGTEMDLLAKSLLAGEGLSSPFGPPTGPTAMIAPAYPVFVAAVFGVFGIESVAATVVIMAVHTLLNLATVWLILRLGRGLATEQCTVVAAAFWACSLPVIWMPAIFWETSFSACLLLGGVAFALDLSGTRSHWRWTGGGVCCGIAGLFNPALLPSFLALGAWAALTKSRDAMEKPALALAAFVLVFSPWPIRNAYVFHAFVPTRTTVGFELWVGNHEGATGFLQEEWFPTFNAVELADYRQRGELAYFKHKAALAKDFLRSHPGLFLELTARRTVRFWTGTGNQNGSVFFPIHAWITSLLGIGGLVFLLRSSKRQRALYFVIPLVLFPLPYTVTHAEFRYRLVVDPVLCALAAYALSSEARERRSGRERARRKEVSAESAVEPACRSG